MRAVLCAFAAVALLMPANVAAAPILINASFELGPVFSSQDLDILPGSTDVTGWRVTGGGVDLLGAPWDVSDGSRGIDLDRRSPGGIEQSFATIAGQTYSVFFDLSGNPGNGSPGTGLPTVKQVGVGVGSFSQVYSFDSTGQSIGSLLWQPIAFSFTALEGTSTLSFASLSPAGNAYGALIDNVRVAPAPVPESSTLLLLGAGLVAMILRFGGLGKPPVFRGWPVKQA